MEYDRIPLKEVGAGMAKELALLGSPLVLERSGVGSPDILTEAKRDVVSELLGVAAIY